MLAKSIAIPAQWCLWEKNFGGLGAKPCALAESALDCVEAHGAEGNIPVKLSSLKGNQH